MTKPKELVTLRQRKTKNGGQTLYLDYTVNGVRTREFLRMYLVPERTRVDKLQNRETLIAAEAMKTRRTIEMQEGKAGIRRAAERDMLVTDYVKERAEFYRKQGQVGQAGTMDKIRRWLLDYGRRATLRTVDKRYILEFVRHMRQRGLAESTIYLYFSNLNTVFNHAYREDLIRENPISKMDVPERPRPPESNREYLTFDEVRKLTETRCGNESVKRAFLFACFTGLRLSDIEALTWDRVRDSGRGMQVEATQIKTKRAVYVPLSSNALAQLPERGEGKVFDLPNRVTIGEDIRDWVGRAGIGKRVTFHCARHTYATMLLTFGANLYTVSSLLGHANISTTQLYAKIVDENKRMTVDLIPSIGER
ncbi:MAG: site-specific integrase [Bacteroidales bacterium]|nr:site-specific integrase [Bacteroidales bacterium]